MPRIGDKRPGAGRPPGGTYNKITRDVRAIALKFTAEAITGLVGLARSPKTPPAARVAAWNAVLDRAVGKPVQGLEHAGADGGPINDAIAMVALTEARFEEITKRVADEF